MLFINQVRFVDLITLNKRDGGLQCATIKPTNDSVAWIGASGFKFNSGRELVLASSHGSSAYILYKTPNAMAFAKIDVLQHSRRRTLGVTRSANSLRISTCAMGRWVLPLRGGVCA